MRKLLFLVLFLVIGAHGIENYSGWLDTSIVNDTLDSATVKYSRTFLLSDKEDIRVFCFANDTGIAGLGSDSLNFSWGYQTGYIVMDSAMADSLETDLDTAWDDRTVLDSMRADSAGVSNEATQAANGTLTRALGGVDSISVVGFMYQSRWFVPQWDGLIRFWAKGIGDADAPGLGQTEARAVIVYFLMGRRNFSAVRNK